MTTKQRHVSESAPSLTDLDNYIYKSHSNVITLILLMIDVQCQPPPVSINSVYYSLITHYFPTLVVRTLIYENIMTRIHSLKLP